ncbi:DUF4188 domain-containing protein [Planomicrobium sp. CPCC 101110]|nr:DUF4188 domain-containing protein [Planomicrobium sp. CPCC 101110]TWT24428.1 DUF4188 domain-containing protein [Planomicrobium sp. CPCC 101110]
MGKVVKGRYTAESEDSFVIFVIGFRINKLWAIHHWFPLIIQMQGMINELYRNKELGFLDMKFFLSWKGITLIQYWDSFEQLEHYSKHGALHLTAWKNFNQKIAKGNKVGFYHETYIVESGNYESIYINMPVYGLARATNHIPIKGRKETAKGRLQKSL